MNKSKRIDYDSIVEKYILIVMWVVATISFTIAMFSYNWFRYSDIIGISGIILMTIVFFIYKKATFYFMFVVLFIGMLNIATFEYYLNLGVTFKYHGDKIQPGVQLYSTILMAIFLIFRKPKLIEIYQFIFHETEQDKQLEYNSNFKYFKEKYINVSNKELDELLSIDSFAKAAKDALQEIK